MFVKRPLVIGGGIAGLVACIELERLGHAPILIEKESELGGRLKTDWVDGVPIDRGFQILLTAYPEVKRLLDVDALDPIWLDSAARVFRASGGAPVLVGDPRRCFSDLMATWSSGLVSGKDAWNMWRHLQGMRTPKRVRNLFAEKTTQRTTAEMLESKGYSVELVDEFFRPFFGGIFLDRSLTVPESMFNFVLSMFATGRAILPRQGMAAVVNQLQSKLQRTDIRLGAQVGWVDEDGRCVRLAAGESFMGDGVILATPGWTRSIKGEWMKDDALDWNRTVRYVWSLSADVKTFNRPLIGLTPGSKRITNMHFFRDLNSKWPDWVSVTAVSGMHDIVDIADDHEMRQEFKLGTGIVVRETIAMQDIPMALPQLRHPVYEPALESTWLSNGVLKAGDDRSNPSFNGAARSGAQAAIALHNNLNAHAM